MGVSMLVLLIFFICNDEAAEIWPFTLERNETYFKLEQLKSSPLTKGELPPTYTVVCTQC